MIALAFIVAYVLIALMFAAMGYYAGWNDRAEKELLRRLRGDDQ